MAHFYDSEAMEKLFDGGDSTCKFCAYKVRSLGDHIQSAHIRWNCCPVCKKAFQSKRLMLYHLLAGHVLQDNDLQLLNRKPLDPKHTMYMRQMLTGSEFNCTLCDKSFNYRPHMLGHIYYDHYLKIRIPRPKSLGNNRCPKCPFKGTVTKHFVAVHSSINMCQCPACKLLFKSNKIMIEHLYQRHAIADSAENKEISPNEMVASKSMPEKESVVNANPEPKVILCIVCEILFKTETLFLKHLDDRHKSTKVDILKSMPKHKSCCLQCNKNFNDLWKHQIGFHNRKKRKPFPKRQTECTECTFCEKEFKNKHLAATHVYFRHYKNQIHIPEGINNKCPSCEYQDKGYRRHYIMEHCGINLLECPVCNRNFVSFTEMTIHLHDAHPKSGKTAKGKKARNSKPSFIEQEGAAQVKKNTKTTIGLNQVVGADHGQGELPNNRLATQHMNSDSDNRPKDQPKPHSRWDDEDESDLIICPVCEVNYKSVKNLYGHVKEVHQFKAREILGLMSKRTARCPMCKHTLYTDFWKHLINKHTPWQDNLLLPPPSKAKPKPPAVKIECSLCDLTFANKWRMAIHLYLEHFVGLGSIEKSYQGESGTCKVCKIPVLSLIDHVQELHILWNECPVCKLQTTCKSQLLRHILTHAVALGSTVGDLDDLEEFDDTPAAEIDTSQPLEGTSSMGQFDVVQLTRSNVTALNRKPTKTASSALSSKLSKKSRKVLNKLNNPKRAREINEIDEVGDVDKETNSEDGAEWVLEDEPETIRCPTCKLDFTSIQLFVGHLQSKHFSKMVKILNSMPLRSGKCPKCRSSYKNIWGHMKRQHSKKLEPKFKAKKPRVKVNKVVQCEVQKMKEICTCYLCANEFSNRARLAVHIYLEHYNGAGPIETTYRGPNGTCKVCDIGVGSLVNHVELVHTKWRECPICQKIVNSKLTLLSHIMTHAKST